jgi:hypothetical protein
MKINLFNLITIVAVAGFLSSNIALAEDKPTSAQEHGLHHPDAPSTAKETKPSNENSGMMGGGMMNKDMMGKMDMNQMMGMMNSCMEQHKDGKMCDHQTMEECQKNMDHKGCQKMMKEMKSQKKTPKSK